MFFLGIALAVAAGILIAQNIRIVSRFVGKTLFWILKIALVAFSFGIFAYLIVSRDGGMEDEDSVVVIFWVTAIFTATYFFIKPFRTLINKRIGINDEK